MQNLTGNLQYALPLSGCAAGSPRAEAGEVKMFLLDGIGPDLLDVYESESDGPQQGEEAFLQVKVLMQSWTCFLPRSLRLES